MKLAKLYQLILLVVLLVSPVISCTERKYEETISLDSDILSSELKSYLETKEEFVDLSGFTPPEEIDLSNSIKVTIECEHGKVETIQNAVASYGRVVLVIDDMLQVYIPFSNFKYLADIQGLTFIRFPIRGNCDNCEK